MIELPGENNFKKLLSSLLFDSLIESEKRTPADIRKKGYITERAALKQERWLFCTEIDRILTEMELIISFL